VRSFIIALMLVLGTASVEAAILSNSQGQVTVQTSQGPRTVAGSFEVAQGDVVTTGAGRQRRAEFRQRMLPDARAQ
jgi:hypothetical protein